MIEQPKGGDWGKFGEVIEELAHKNWLRESEEWEKKLRLHIKPKPEWCPSPLWKKLVNLVVIQTTEIR